MRQTKRRSGPLSSGPSPHCEESLRMVVSIGEGEFLSGFTGFVIFAPISLTLPWSSGERAAVRTLKALANWIGEGAGSRELGTSCFSGLPAPNGIDSRQWTYIGFRCQSKGHARLDVVFFHFPGLTRGHAGFPRPFGDVNQSQLNLSNGNGLI